jgi:hypothetical protein
MRGTGRMLPATTAVASGSSMPHANLKSKVTVLVWQKGSVLPRHLAEKPEWRIR